MRSWGVLLLVLGIGSFILPQFDMQFALVSLVEDYQPFAGIALAIIGGILLGLSFRKSAGTASKGS